MAGTKRTTRSKAAPSKRSTSPVEEKVQVLTKQQFSKLSAAIVKQYAERNGLDPEMARKDIATALFGADDTILAGHRMKWAAPWTPQNAPMSPPAGSSNAQAVNHRLDIEGSKQRLRNGEIADPAEEHAVKDEVISAALLSISSTNEAARRMLNRTTGAGEGSQAQPVVVDVDGTRPDHAFANQTTAAPAEAAEASISATSQNSYPSPAVSTLDSPATAPLAEPNTQANGSSRKRKSYAPAKPSNLGKRTRDSEEDDMQEGESEEDPSERPAKQQRRTSTLPASQEPSTAEQDRATPSPPNSPRLTAAQKGKGKVVSPASPPTPHSPARNLAHPPAATAAEPREEVVDLSQDIDAAHAAASTRVPASSASAQYATEPAPSHPQRSLRRERNVFLLSNAEVGALHEAQDALSSAHTRNTDSLAFLRNIALQEDNVRRLEAEAKAIVDAAKSQVEHARIILGYEQNRRSKGRAELDRRIKLAVTRDEGCLEWEDETFSDDELEPVLYADEPDRKEEMYTEYLEHRRSADEWWKKRMAWKALLRGNKEMARQKAAPYTAKDVPKLIQAERERALRVVKEARARRDLRVTQERQARGEEAGPVDHEVPFVPEDFEGIEEDVDAENPEGDGWLVWDWFTSPDICDVESWEPSFVQTGLAKSEYFTVY
ncbi:unnamed protein product [Peniophora sp. CBMAI 1063]|nr:unnamed protein product [Peniophora sp. CBMAI 1063]